MPGIERGERFIEEQQARAHQQRTADGHALALAARQQPRPAIQQMTDIEQCDDAREFILEARMPAHPAAIIDILSHAEMRE